MGEKGVIHVLDLNRWVRLSQMQGIIVREETEEKKYGSKRHVLIRGSSTVWLE